MFSGSIETNKEYSSRPCLNAFHIAQQISRRVAYSYSGIASAHVIFNSIKEVAENLSEKLKLNLSSQIIINVIIDQNGKYKGYSFIYISNPILYCLVVGLNECGERPLSLEDEKKMELETETETSKIIEGKKDEIGNEVLKLMCPQAGKARNKYKRKNKIEIEKKQQEVMDKFRMETYDEVYMSKLSIFNNDKYLIGLQMKYEYDKSTAISLLGPEEGKKQRIVGNLGTLTFISASTSVVFRSKDNRYNELVMSRGYQIEDNRLLQIFKPFTSSNDYPKIRRDNNIFVEFAFEDDCIFASMICKRIMIDGEEYYFDFPRNRK